MLTEQTYEKRLILQCDVKITVKVKMYSYILKFNNVTSLLIKPYYTYLTVCFVSERQLICQDEHRKLLKIAHRCIIQ